MRELFIGVLVIILGGIHILSGQMAFEFHMVHQQLFFIPLVLTSFWFGLPVGIAVAGLISLLYGPPMYYQEHHVGIHSIVLSQICLYFFVAALMGYLSDRRRKQEEQLLQGERLATLGKTATALSFEIDDIARRIVTINKEGEGFKQPAANEQFTTEIDRLQLLIKTLKRFLPSFQKITLSSDLNDILAHTKDKFQAEAKKKGLKLLSTPDPAGCPTLLSLEKIATIYESLVRNAIFFSSKGDCITLASSRHGEACDLSVIDEGKGVAPANIAKLFTPFFTTRVDGYGLSLSSGKKLLKKLGGDITYRPGTAKGAIFTMSVPREDRSNTLNDYVRNVLSPPSQTSSRGSSGLPAFLNNEKPQHHNSRI